MTKFFLCALAVIIALVATVGCNTDVSQLAPKPVTLNADEYRQEIADIDRLLFSPKAYDESRREKLAGNLEALASRITAGSDSRFLKMEASEIRTLASLTKHTSASAPRDSLENNWIRIRNNLFEDRYWMARSAADLESP
jgi:alcohol dehydrogenase class IV